MSFSYAQLSVGGNNDENTVKKAQKLLNQQLGADLAVDGIYGPKTYAAVKQYQKANQLQPDGILGAKTWASLLGQEGLPETDLSQEGWTAKQQYLALKNNPPAEFAFSGQELLQQAQQAYLNRTPFAYDPGADPVYQQYRDSYLQAGRLAMEDTIGKAAALTGGYGNSYAQTAGQQTYQGYLQQLTDILPELYDLAYNKYRQRGEELKDRYDLLQAQRKDAYSQYRDGVDRYDDQLSQLYRQYQDALDRYDRQQTEQYRQQQDGLDRYDQQQAEQYRQQQDELDRQEAYGKQLIQLIEKGYIPTDDELAAAGMSRRQADLLAKNALEKD